MSMFTRSANPMMRTFARTFVSGGTVARTRAPAAAAVRDTELSNPFFELLHFAFNHRRERAVPDAGHGCGHRGRRIHVQPGPRRARRLALRQGRGARIRCALPGRLDEGRTLIQPHLALRYMDNPYG